MKTVYLFEPDTGLFSGVYFAQESPLEEGVFITPTYSTDVVPTIPEGGTARWVDGAWEEVAAPTPSPTPAPAPTPTPETPDVPVLTEAEILTQWRLASEVPMYKLRLALLAVGKLELVTLAIGMLPLPIRQASSIEWEYSQTVQRRGHLINRIAPIVGLSDAGLDTVFRNAEAL